MRRPLSSQEPASRDLVDGSQLDDHCPFLSQRGIRL